MRRLWSAVAGGIAAPARRQIRVDDITVAEDKLLSEGGFAYVYKVHDVEDGTIYALKKVLCQEQDAFETAKREVDILDDLPKHKNIVSYFGSAVGYPEGQGSRKREVMMLFEFCSGGHLADYLEAHKGMLTEVQMLIPFTDVAEAVFCLHSHHPAIQHRDLKLENVLKGEDGFWKVCDFGSWSGATIDLSSASAKELGAIGEDLEKSTTLMYRPPEMADIYQRLPITCAVDIWMLGCILYALMFNRHPFQEGSMLAIRDAQYVLPRRDPPVSDKLTDLLVWLLSHDPRHRPTARKLVNLLWQWKDLPSLDLPEAVQAKKQRLLEGAFAAANAKARQSKKAQEQQKQPPPPPQPQVQQLQSQQQSQMPMQSGSVETPATNSAPDSGGEQPPSIDALAGARVAASPTNVVEPTWVAFPDASPKVIDPFGDADTTPHGTRLEMRRMSSPCRLADVPASALAAVTFGEDDFNPSLGEPRVSAKRRESGPAVPAPAVAGTSSPSTPPATAPPAPVASSSSPCARFTPIVASIAEESTAKNADADVAGGEAWSSEAGTTAVASAHVLNRGDSDQAAMLARTTERPAATAEEAVSQTLGQASEKEAPKRRRERATAQVVEQAAAEELAAEEPVGMESLEAASASEALTVAAADEAAERPASGGDVDVIGPVSVEAPTVDNQAAGANAATAETAETANLLPPDGNEPAPAVDIRMAEPSLNLLELDMEGPPDGANTAAAEVADTASLLPPDGSEPVPAVDAQMAEPSLNLLDLEGAPEGANAAAAEVVDTATSLPPDSNEPVAAVDVQMAEPSLNLLDLEGARDGTNAAEAADGATLLPLEGGEPAPAVGLQMAEPSLDLNLLDLEGEGAASDVPLIAADAVANAPTAAESQAPGAAAIASLLPLEGDTPAPAVGMSEPSLIDLEGTLDEAVAAADAPSVPRATEGVEKEAGNLKEAASAEAAETAGEGEETRSTPEEVVEEKTAAVEHDFERPKVDEVADTPVEAAAATHSSESAAAAAEDAGEGGALAAEAAAATHSSESAAAAAEDAGEGGALAAEEVGEEKTAAVEHDFERPKVDEVADTPVEAAAVTHSSESVAAVAEDAGEGGALAAEAALQQEGSGS